MCKQEKIAESVLRQQCHLGLVDRWGVFVCIVFAFVGVAGCTSPSPPTPSGAATALAPVGPREVDLTDTTGAIDGSVLDNELRPIPDALLEARYGSAKGALTALSAGLSESEGFTAQTDSEGRFTIGPLAEGHYALFVYASGYAAQAVGVEVKGGERLEKQFVLEPLATIEPYSHTIERVGRWQVAATGVFTCSAELAPFFGACASTQSFAIGPGWNASVVEIAWRATTASTTKGVKTQMLGQRMPDEPFCAGTVDQFQPVRLVLRPLQRYGDVRVCGDDPAYPEHNFTMVHDYFPWDGPDRTSVSFTMDQTFTIWNTVFYYEGPRDDFSARPAE
jgi:hypothetical protein